MMVSKNQLLMNKHPAICWVDKFIFSIILLEMFLGGSGRFAEITSFFTLRMCLYSLALIAAMYTVIRKRSVKANIYFIILIYNLMLVMSFLIGFVNEAPLNMIFQDIKPLSYFMIVIYLSTRIVTYYDVGYVIKLLKISTLILASLHIILSGMIMFSIFDFDILWNFFNIVLNSNDNDEPGEFFFKGDYGFIYYKGDFYLCAGFFFWERLPASKYKKIIALCLIGLAIILTGTRGFILMIALTYLVNWCLNEKNIKFLINNLTFVIIIISVLLVILLWVYQFTLGYSQYIGDKLESDAIRFQQFHQVIDRVNPVSALVGHGYGVGVPVRPVHMEIAYLEIFHKQGLLGELIWLGLLFYIFILYRKKSNVYWRQAFWLVILFAYLLSATNPYINHPLGLMLIALSIACLNVSSDEKTQNSV